MIIKKGELIKKTAVLLSAVMLVTGLAACGKEQEKNAEFKPALPTETSCSIRVAGTYSNFESLESEFERFYEYYPNASLNYVYLDNYDNTIVSALLSDEAPDIYVTATWMLDDKKMAPVFENAEVLSDPSLNIDLDCIRKGARWTAENGDVVMLPIFTRSYGMLVNMDIFEKNGLKVPTDYKSLVEVCDKLKAAGYETPIMGANGNTVSGMYYAFSFPLFCDNVLKKPESVAPLNAMDKSAGEMMRPALEKLQDFVKKGYLNPARCSEEIADDYNAVIMRFFEGDVPMMLGSGDMVSGTAKRESKSEAFTANPFKYKFYVVPIDDDGGFFLDAVNLFFSVNKNSKNLDMANEFMRFLVCTEELNLMAKAKRMVTPCVDMSLDSVYAPFQSLDGKHFINMSDFGLADKPASQVSKAGWQVAAGKMTVDEAVAAFGSIQ